MNAGSRLQLSTTNLLFIILASLLAVFIFLFSGSSYQSALVPRKEILSWNITASLVNDPNTWGDDIPPFYVFHLEDPTDEHTLAQECLSGLEKGYCHSLLSSPRRVRSLADAKIFFVPLFPSMIKDLEGLKIKIRLLFRERYFMKFRGSDFVFLCYVGNCAGARKSVLEGLRVAVRAIWVDRGDSLPWPCDGRRITVHVDSHNAPITNWKSEYRRLLYILRQAGLLINGRNRWSCNFGEVWNLKRFEIPYYSQLVYIAQISLKDRVMYCGVPKVSSSVSVILMRRMNGLINWKTVDDADIRNYQTGVHWRLRDQTSTFRIFDDANWVKGMLVRNPVTRLLSAYRSKIEKLEEYERLPGGAKIREYEQQPPTFAEFLIRLEERYTAGKLENLDIHFRPQSSLCDLRHLPFDFIGRFEDHERDMRDFLESLELWEKIGQSGWGPKGKDSLFAADEKLTLGNNLKPVTNAGDKSVLREYYTNEMLESVITMFQEDFVRFDYSMNVNDYV